MRLIFADWLEEREIQHAQRFIVRQGAFPYLTACGQSYGPNWSRGCNYEWTFGMETYGKFGISVSDADYLPYHHRSRRAAEAALIKAILGQEQYRIGKSLLENAS